MKIKQLLPALSIAAICAAVLFFRQEAARAQLSADQHSFKFGKYDLSIPGSWLIMSPRPTEPGAGFGVKILTTDKQESAEVMFFLIGTPSSQATTSSVDRWLGRFTDGRSKINYKEQPLQISSQKLTVYTADGSYRDNTNSAPKRDYGFSCTALASESQTLLIRSIGPTNAVNNAHSEVYQMLLNSIRF